MTTEPSATAAPAPARLPTRQVGSTGIRLTELGLGGAPFGNLFAEVAEADVRATVEAAHRLGLRYVDTAPHYGLGLSERRLSALVPAGVVLSTKVGRLLVPDPPGAARRDPDGFHVPADHRRVWDFSRAGVLRSLEESLLRLDRDRVDIVYLHDPDDHWDRAVAEALPALVELREQGVIGAVGVGMNQSAMPAEFVRRTDVDVVMVAGRYTLLEQPALDDLLPVAAQRGVGVVIAGVYNSGLLARRRPLPGATYDYAPAPAALLARVHRIADVCERHGTTLPDAAIAFVLAHPAVVSVVVGARTAAEITESVARYHRPVPAQLWDELRAAGLLRADAPVPG